MTPCSYLAVSVVCDDVYRGSSNSKSCSNMSMVDMEERESDGSWKKGEEGVATGFMDTDPRRWWSSMEMGRGLSLLGYLPGDLIVIGKVGNNVLPFLSSTLVAQCIGASNARGTLWLTIVETLVTP